MNPRSAAFYHEQIFGSFWVEHQGLRRVLSNKILTVRSTVVCLSPCLPLALAALRTQLPATQARAAGGAQNPGLGFRVAGNLAPNSIVRDARELIHLPDMLHDMIFNQLQPVLANVVHCGRILRVLRSHFGG